MKRPSIVRSGSIVAVAMLVAGCGGRSDQIGAQCPEIGTIDKGGELTRFGDGGRDTEAIDLRALMTLGARACAINSATGIATFDLDVIIDGERGRASSTAVEPVEYFVAISDPEGNIVQRQQFTTTLDFGQLGGGARTIDRLALNVPLSREELLADYRIYAAFQLSQAQIDYNFETRAR